jgi:hypothetical protein
MARRRRSACRLRGAYRAWAVVLVFAPEEFLAMSSLPFLGFDPRPGVRSYHGSPERAPMAASTR